MKKDKFNTLKSGYRFHKPLLKFFFIFMALLILPQLFWSVGNGLFGDGWLSAECVLEDGRPGGCMNPYYNKCLSSNSFAARYPDLCLYESLPDGFVFNALPWYYDLYQIPCMLLLFGYFVLNHFKYNKQFVKDKEDRGKEDEEQSYY